MAAGRQLEVFAKSRADLRVELARFARRSPVLRGSEVATRSGPFVSCKFTPAEGQRAANGPQTPKATGRAGTPRQRQIQWPALFPLEATLESCLWDWLWQCIWDWLWREGGATGGRVAP